MQNRTAILLSLGMLLEKVDASIFIGKMLKRASEANSTFAFTSDIQKQSFMLCEKFNRNEVEPDAFKTQLVSMLGIQMTDEDFWNDWNSMLIVGELINKIKLLQDVAHDNQAIIYLYTDTNRKHLEKIAEEAKKQGIAIDLSKQPAKVDQMPLFVSCQVGRNRKGLVEHTVNEIQAQEFKPNAVVLILGDPENIKDKNQKGLAQAECKAITEWCGSKDVSVTLHQQDLNETFAKITKKDNTNIKAMSMI